MLPCNTFCKPLKQWVSTSTFMEHNLYNTFVYFWLDSLLVPTMATVCAVLTIAYTCWNIGHHAWWGESERQNYHKRATIYSKGCCRSAKTMKHVSEASLFRHQTLPFCGFNAISVRICSGLRKHFSWCPRHIISVSDLSVSHFCPQHNGCL